MRFLLPSLILGFTAGVVVPFVSGLLQRFLPPEAAKFLPSSEVPQLGMQSLISIVVFGLLLTLSLSFIQRAIRSFS